MSSLLKLHPQKFVEFLVSKNIQKAAVIYNPSTKQFDSCPELQPLCRELEQLSDFSTHEGIFFQISEQSKTFQGAFLHRTCRGPAAGGVRNMPYNTMEEYFRDGMRLSQGMTHKNALAHLWWGGGKGVMIRNTGVGLEPECSQEERKLVYQEYGKFMTDLKGCYITAEDYGTNVEDMRQIFSKTRFTTCIPEDLGGSGNPSIPTAHGVIKGLEGYYSYNNDSLKDKVILVQGCGNVGQPLIARLINELGVKKVYVSDIDENKILRFRETLGDRANLLEIVQEADLMQMEADALIPCAKGAILNPGTIKNLKVNVICGAANNQLEVMERDDLAISQKNITYIPDFLVNRMGIVNCADEDVSVGYIENDAPLSEHMDEVSEKSIYLQTKQILEQSQQQGKTAQEISLMLAEDLSKKEHPLWGHRWKGIAKFVGRNRYNVQENNQ